MRRYTIQAAVAALGAVAVLGGLIAGGRALRGRLADAEQYQFPFADIQFNSPPADAAQFLSEVRYLGDFPERVSLLDDGLRRRLKEAFERHGWVESARVAIGPGKRISAQLTFRTPVLAVHFAEGIRAVDATGVLLPRSADVGGVPLLSGAKAPAGAAGKPWGDPHVEAAARVAGVLRPRQATLRLMAFEYNAEGKLALRRRPESWPAVVWGRPPGEEAEGEPAASEKLQRLLQRCESPAGWGDPNQRSVIDLSK